MSIEDKLKECIIQKYSSYKNLGDQLGISPSTLHSILNNIESGSWGRISKICKALNISADALSRGEIVNLKDEHQGLDTHNGDLIKMLSDIKAQLLMIDNPNCNGKLISKEDISTLTTLIDIIISLIEKKYP